MAFRLGAEFRKIDKAASSRRGYSRLGRLVPAYDRGYGYEWTLLVCRRHPEPAGFVLRSCDARYENRISCTHPGKLHLWNHGLLSAARPAHERSSDWLVGSWNILCNQVHLERLASE